MSNARFDIARCLVLALPLSVAAGCASVPVVAHDSAPDDVREAAADAPFADEMADGRFADAVDGHVDARAPDALDATPPPTDAVDALDTVAMMSGCAASASGTSPIWTCSADHVSRQRCVNSSVQTETCAHGCVSQPLGTDDYCAPDCSGSASGTSSVWTCTSDGLERQRCISGGTQTEMCPTGCISQPAGVDDFCGVACASSASGTSSIWTCTTDHTARQHCVGGATVTEPCAHGCVSQPIGVDDYCASDCTGSASGTSPIWTCTADRSSRQRCQNGVIETEACPSGCMSQPLGTDDACLAPPPPGSVVCAYPQWWNAPYSWDPGFYAIHGSYAWDNDLAEPAWTPVQLRHASTLLREGTYAWGWMPEFHDTVTGQDFALLHLQPSRRLTLGIGTTYPAGTLVGFSGGATPETGYCVAIPGCGVPDCAAALCVYSTGAHLCVQTTVPFHTAFPVGTDACQ